MLDRAHFEDLDAQDPFRATVAQFRLPEGTVYLDGNSLGPLPAHVTDVLGDVVERQWGEDLITSWNRNGWWTMARAVGDKLAPVIGAPPASVIAGDGTSVALYKAVGAALALRPDRSVVLTDTGNFPTDLYVLRSVASRYGAEVLEVEPGEVAGAIDAATAVVALTHVDYRTSRRHPMGELTERAHAAGSVVVWDLCHSAGVLDLDLTDVDLAVGCGYKYLNGGPGSPAFIYVHPEHQDVVENPINGWWGHDEPFAMQRDFTPAAGIDRMQVGTQPILSLAAFHAALDVFAGVDMARLEEKAHRLTSDFIRLVDARLDGFEVIAPRQPEQRGSHVSLRHPDAPAIMAALISSGVIGDVRPPHLLRFGFSPIFQRHVDVWDAVEVMSAVMAGDAWRRAPVPIGPVT